MLLPETHHMSSSRAMELVHTGRMWSTQEAEGEGSAAAAVREAVTLAAEIASKNRIALQAQEEAVNAGTFPRLLVFLLWMREGDPHLCLFSLVGLLRLTRACRKA